MSSIEPRTGKRPSRIPAIVALAMAVVGGVLGYAGFVTGIDATLAGHEPGASIIVFFVGAGLSFAAIVVATVSLLRTTAKLLSTIALALGLFPLAGLIVIALGTRH